MRTVEEVFEIQKDKCVKFEDIKLLPAVDLFLDVDRTKYDPVDNLDIYTTKDGLLYRKLNNGTFKYYTGASIIAIGEPDQSIEYTIHRKLFINFIYEGEKSVQVMEFDFNKK